MFNNLSDNLNYLMAKARLSSSELARLTGLPATTIKRIRNHEQCNPTIATLLPIAKHFSVTLTELLGSSAPTPQSITVEALNPASSIPVFSWRECINYAHISYKEHKTKIMTERKISDLGYALMLENKEISFFPPNCLLIIDPLLKPEAGDYIIVAKSQSKTASLKQLVIETDGDYLKSLLPGLGLTLFTNEYKMLGIVLQCRVELKI